METKLCPKCGVEKPIEEFTIHKHRNKYIRYSYCHECELEYKRQYKKTEEGKKKTKEYKIKYRNSEKGKQKQKEYEQRWRGLNSDKIKEYRLKYTTEKREQYLKYKRIQYQKHKDTNKAYTEKNRDKIRKWRRKRDKERKQNDVVYLMKCKVRSSLNSSFSRKGMKKQYKSESLFGCKWEYFIQYLLQTYIDNYGYEWDGIEKIHIDHKTPLATAKTKEEVIKLCHYSNLQLLKEKDNLGKSDKLNWSLEDNLTN